MRTRNLCLLWAGLILFFMATTSSPAQSFEEVRFVGTLTAGLTRPVAVAVDQERHIYVLDQDNGRIAVFDPQRNFQFHFDEPEDDTARLRGPCSLAFSPRGRVVVADTGSNRVQVFNKAGKFLFRFGSFGSLPGQFRDPVSVAVDRFGFMFVADRVNRRVQVFSPNGIFISEIALDFRPRAIAVDNQRHVYVLAPEKGRIVVLDATGQVLQEVSGCHNKRGFLKDAAGLAVDMRGDIYITENAESSIKKFDRNETLLCSFGSQGPGRGQFSDLAGITFDQQGRIYVADQANGRVQVLELSGSDKALLETKETCPLTLDFDSTLSAGKGVADLVALPGKGVYFLSDREAKIRCSGRVQLESGKQGGLPGQFRSPKAMAVTLDGRILVADTGSDRIQIINADGSPDYVFGAPGKRAGEFNDPSGIAVNSQGHIYVADSLNHRVQVFNHDGIFLKSFGPQQDKTLARDFSLRNPRSIIIGSHDQVYVLDAGRQQVFLYSAQGEFLRALGERGSGEGQFENPVDIALDENGRLYVADQGNYRVQVFDTDGEFLLTFGSPGTGGGYFQDISAVSVAEGKIYVADYVTDEIQIFRYGSEGLSRDDRIYATRTADPQAEGGDNLVKRYTRAKQQALLEAVEEICRGTGMAESTVKKYMNVDSMSSLSNGQIKITVSIPKNIVPQRQAARLTGPAHHENPTSF